MSPARTVLWEPQVGWREYRCLASWEKVDCQASDLLSVQAIAVPSVRVGMCWAMECLGCRRHADEVLVPRFMSRCILNALNRFAMPMESPTPKTRLAIVVHQFGFHQRLDAIEAACRARDMRYLEDSPCGVLRAEQPGPGSLAKFIGLSKLLPALKGAVMLTADRELQAFVTAKRRQSSAWSWWLLGMLATLRGGRSVGAHSALAELAYEMYLESGGDNAVFRGNLLCALRRVPAYERVIAARLAFVKERLGRHVIVPEAMRLAYVVPLIAGDQPKAMQAVLAWHGCDAGLYHFDMRRNLFAPDYQRVLLIPLNPQLPQQVFEALVQDLQQVLGAGDGALAPRDAAMPALVNP